MKRVINNQVNELTFANQSFNDYQDASYLSFKQLGSNTRESIIQIDSIDSNDWVVKFEFTLGENDLQDGLYTVYLMDINDYVLDSATCIASEFNEDSPYGYVVIENDSEFDESLTYLTYNGSLVTYDNNYIIVT